MDDNVLSQRYGSDRWPRRAQLDGRCERFVIPADLFERERFRLVWRDALPGPRHAYRSVYVHDADDRRLMVDVIPAHSFDGAKEELLAGFRNCASIVPPSAVPHLGDVSYGNQAAQRFVRGNLLISVSNAGTAEVDVRPFAVSLDKEAANCLH